MKLVAAASAAIVAVGVVTVPTTIEAASAHYVPAAQIQTHAIDLTAAALPLPGTGATNPQANAIAESPQQIVTALALTAAAIAVTPLWYAGLPVTLPATFAVVGFLASAIARTGYLPLNTPIVVVGGGLIGWAVAPLIMLKLAADYWTPRLKSPAAAGSNSTTPSASAAPSPHHADRVKRGVGNSRRAPTTKPDIARTPATHRSAKPARAHATPAKKQAGTAGSGRTVSTRSHE